MTSHKSKGVIKHMKRNENMFVMNKKYLFVLIHILNAAGDLNRTV